MPSRSPVSARNRSVPRWLAIGATVLTAVAGCTPVASSSSAPAGATVFFNGDAHVSVSGPETGEFTVPLARGNVLPGGFITAEYAEVQQGALTYQGPAQVGEHQTARTETNVTSLMITLPLPDNDPPYDSYISIAGECTIDVTAAGPSGGEASFSCTQVPNLDGTVKVDAEGTFDAAP
jgi:hypothetical protein